VTLAAGTQIGKYVVIKKLAEGGMAEIYLATSQGAEGFEKEVVIKRIRSFMASDPGFVDMFIAEARLASRLNHANVVQIFDFAKHEDTYYLAMEYVRGCTLSDLRKKCKDLLEPMPPVLVAHIGAEVARGLHYAHRLKVNGEPLFLVHRDVTPHNVLISFDGAVKLTDFGIAKAGNKLTSPGMLKGKFAYMSPEQSRGENVDARTDVFALGIVIWEMLTGGRLFDGDSDLAVLRAVQQSVIASPSRLNPDVPEELSAVVMKALERNPEARYQTAGELERALVQCVLNHAQSPDDTDVASFVRRVYIGVLPSALALPALPERTQQLQGGQVEAEPVPREPTAVLPGPRGRSRATGAGGEGSPPAHSPDEDVHASTHMLPAREGSLGGKSKPPRVNTPGRPLPAVSGAEAALPTVRPPSQRIPAVSSASFEEDSEPPRYEPTVSLPSQLSSAPPAAQAKASSNARRVGMGVGIGVVVLFAAVGVDSLLRSRPQEPQPVAGPAQGTPAAPPVVEAPSTQPSTPPDSAAPQDVKPATDPGSLAVVPPVDPAPAPVPAPTPAQNPPTAETPPAKPASVKGSVIVRATPYATVLVNGRSYGDVQGQKTLKLDPGSYQLIFRHPKGDKTERFTLEPNGTVKLEFRAAR
jgi:serine/threonine-protein kinase